MGPASYQFGFAPRDGTPAFPELRRGLQFAAAPCLGPTGLALKDWSGFENDGTLTNGPIWSVASGRRCIDFDGTDDLVSVTLPATVQSTSVFGVSVWLQPDTLGITQNVASTWRYLNSSGWMFFVNASGTLSLYMLDGAAGNYFYADSTTAIAANTLSHVFVMSTNGTGAGIRFWINGRPSGTTPGTVGSGNPGTLTSTSLWIGRRQNGAGDNPFNGKIADLMIWQNANQGWAKTLSLRPGIAYELAPRRRASSGIAFNRRRRLLVGAHS